MAVLPFDLDEEEQRRQEEAAGGGGNQIAGEPTGGTPGGGDEGGAPQGSPQTRGTSGWTDVNAYLDANKEQAVDTANKIGTRLEEESTGLRTGIDEANTKFRSRIDENTERFDQDLVNRASADPLAFSQNQEDIAKIKKARDAQYGGPTEFAEADEYSDLLGKIDTAQQRARGVDTEAGREALLASVMKNNPSKGMLQLDNLLIGQNKDARDRLTTAAAPFAELGSYLDTTGAGAKTYADAAKKTTADTSAAVKAALEATRGRLGSELDTKLADTRAAATSESQSTLDKLKNFLAGGRGGLTQADLARMGITPEQAGQMFDNAWDLKHAGDFSVTPNEPEGQLNAWWMYGAPKFYDVNFDPSNFASMLSADAQITKENAASAEDYARIAALEGLMDSESGILSQADKGMAGTANKDLLDFRGTEAVGGAKEALRQKDRALASWISGNGVPYGTDISDEQIANNVRGMKGFYDAVMTGRTQYHSANPAANARGIAGILALARLGFYKLPPGSLYASNTTGGDAFVNPEGAN